ncbi:MAG: MBL fold metallo-hydrolase [Streptococcus sp.]
MIGGLGEIGKNTYGIEYQDEIIIVDAGIKFPRRSSRNRLCIPDYSYIVENVDRKGTCIITHGHEDHIGGIPFLLNRQISQFAGPLALCSYQRKLKNTDYFVTHNSTKLMLIQSLLSKYERDLFRNTTQFQNLSVLSSIHPQGKIVCTGDFKFDFTPVGNQQTFTVWLHLVKKAFFASQTQLMLKYQLSLIPRRLLANPL